MDPRYRPVRGGGLVPDKLIPFGFLCAFRGWIDIREHGSGNISATNVGRVPGSRWGLLVLG
jgi:glycerol-3-phosphate acyltransferase PlsY